MPETPTTIVVTSPHRDMADRVQSIVNPRGINVFWEHSLPRAVDRCEEENPDLLLVTGDAGQGGSLTVPELLDLVRIQAPETEVVLLIGADEMQIAAEALESGRYRYVRLPVADEELKMVLDSELVSHPSGEGPAPKGHPDEIIGESAAMEDIYRQVRLAAETDIPVLIEGETGTGKDLVARAIHRQSARSEGPFIPVNLGATPTELVASELFGHTKGAFTGAVSSREGTFEQGHGGTVFLDEIGTIDEKVQVSLLRLIEQKKFNRLGGKRLISSDARIVAATNEDLRELVDRGGFREDLFYRLDVFHIRVPPLRERGNDIVLLANVFLSRYARQFGKHIRRIGAECMQQLQTFEWQGNVRELKNVIQRAVLMCEDATLDQRHLPPRLRESEKASDTVTFRVGTSLEEMEREMVIHTLAAADNNRTRAAQMLGISRRSLYNKLEKHRLK